MTAQVSLYSLPNTLLIKIAAHLDIAEMLFLSRMVVKKNPSLSGHTCNTDQLILEILSSALIARNSSSSPLTTREFGVCKRFIKAAFFREYLVYQAYQEEKARCRKGFSLNFLQPPSTCCVNKFGSLGDAAEPLFSGPPRIEMVDGPSNVPHASKKTWLEVAKKTGCLIFTPCESLTYLQQTQVKENPLNPFKAYLLPHALHKKYKQDKVEYFRKKRLCTKIAHLDFRASSGLESEYKNSLNPFWKPSCRKYTLNCWYFLLSQDVAHAELSVYQNVTSYFPTSGIVVISAYGMKNLEKFSSVQTLLVKSYAHSAGALSEGLHWYSGPLLERLKNIVDREVLSYRQFTIEVQWDKKNTFFACR